MLIVRDTLLAGSPAHVYAFERKEGRPLWDTVVGQCECTPARFVYDEKRDRVVVSAHWVGLASIDIKTGHLCWLQREHPIWFRSSTPIVIGDEIYSCGNRTAYVISAETGEILRQASLTDRTDVSGIPLEVGEELYFPMVDCGVLAVRRDTLERVRTYSTEKTCFSSSPYVSGETETVEGGVQLWNGQLLFAGLDGNVHFYGREDARLLRRIRVGRPITVAPLLLGERLIVADFFGRLTCFPLSEKA